mmetsp:Transcript_11359/g.20914  ORF Transcript_11359/g.20914 Transcript_11359/m.20914 type:complete len:293 (-) Transcript_11359:56-934(-)|eukprot:CAMPEP_0201884456 /NCGR_PEP_ID=MMETSP0902-20130614/17253_1 /ASSEMBLY_ACC=CAM_ASM_000551 /TAXON_ID=420261 /ORGANISM="Thalassiosira antarctica, Strain CCMP982" /LENGTH=292 /DNA_ID=CAMNT_0048413431 /DNA_START=98 /DNA_END=976 /DNA_ORIENTATION=+
MPLPFSKNISPKLGKSGKSTASIVENLKLQHAEELARANGEHAKTVELLHNEVTQCREEIETLKTLSDERSDKFMPLPSPSKSLKYVKNTPVRKPKKVAGFGDKNVANMIVDLKMQHKRDLARAAETYAKKLKREIGKFKAETEALKASEIRGGKQVYDGAGVNLKTGVAANDKENVAQKKLGRKNIQSSTLKNHERDAVQFKTKLQHQSGDRKTSCESESEDGSGNLRDQYERLFLEDYHPPVLEEALALGKDVGDTDLANKEIDEMCKDLIAFMADIKLGDVKIKKLGFC